MSREHVKDDGGSRNLLSHPAALALLGFCLISITLYLWKIQESRDLSQITAGTVSLARSYARETETRYDRIFQALTRLASRGGPRDQTGAEKWMDDATFYIDAFPGIGRIAWVDETFRIRQVVPSQGNESCLGKSASAIEVGPSGINLWLPIHANGTFEGFVFAVLQVESFLAPVLLEIDDDYAMKLSEEGAPVFESKDWNPLREGPVAYETITLGDSTVLGLAFGPTDRLMHSGTVGARRTLVWGLLLSLITMVAAYLARNFSATALLNEFRYRNLFMASRDAIFIIDLAGRYQDANPAATKMVGYSLAELRKMTVADLRPESDEASHLEARLRRWPEGGVQDLVLCGKGGRTIPVELTTSPILERGYQKYVLGIARDITERRRAEEEKLRLEAHLRQSQKLESIGTLASGVAHEINNPLMGMINYADLIAEQVSNGTAREYAQAIMREGRRIAGIVRDLLSFARQDKEAHSPAEIGDIIASSLSLVGSLLRKDHIVVEVDVPEDLPQVECRSQQIRQVIVNLLTNAHHALNERYPEYDENKLVRIKARLFERDGSAWIRTTMEDHGSGISDDVASRIFDPFFTTKPRDRGTGLGLSVSYGIVREHHGELTMESKEGSYTRFYLDLRVDSGWTLRDQDGRD